MSRSPARGAAWRPRLLLLTVLTGGALALAGCAPPAAAPTAALQQFLANVQANEAAYAWNLLTPAAQAQTRFNAFAAAIAATHARYRVVSVRADSATGHASALVEVTAAGTHHYARLYLVEIGTAGDWQVNAPFTARGAAAIAVLQ
ncbi:MAG TPA: hypothetical protein VMW49_00985 [Candidatus Dormibacteraeota bacterium]|nr:hypothetical protein [Candidatus Dormibacteraeota bacterium]